MNNDKGWTPIEIYKSAWAKDKLQEPWAVTLERHEQNGLELNLLTLSQVLDLAVCSDRLGQDRGCTIPAQVQNWMSSLGLAPIGTIGRATKSLSREQNMDILGSWFNGGNGLPRFDDRPGSAGSNAGIRLNLGHPSLMNQFLLWLINYLGAHEATDWRIFPDCERMINLCREIQGKSPVRRF